ncbi:glycerol kinase 5 isoform X1 [Gadus morhua]|uniref:glycerol kinase 5 isoform X1 n=1 Tax=Gadus morhua TaxID=8049 RepID=UPI0011B68F06|nr:putative glycerol kinase 5 isoform X1 [Gadus morhua]
MATQRNGFKKESFILSVDVGTTTIRCNVFDKGAKIRGTCSSKVVLLYPEPGLVELDPEELFNGFIAVVKGAVQDAGVKMSQIVSLGIATQRGTFTTWDRTTGRPFHNFISYQDLRAIDSVTSWNGSYTMKAVQGAMTLLYLVSRQKRFLAASVLVFSPQQVTFRLLWALTHYTQLRQAVAEDTCCFGTIDTWLLFKLTKGEVHATDYSNASSTGMFDPYQMCWSGPLFSMLSLPFSILPKVEDTIHSFGSTHSSIFGVSIPIMALIADQQAAMYGECCFDVGNVNITMGTGAFVDINTGSKPHTSAAGLYPVVGWKIGEEVVYLAEGNAADTGTAIKWAQGLELFSDVQETSAMAYSVADSDGVCFVPSFSGLQAPLNDPTACASFMGLTPSTNKCHLVRAILESVAFSVRQLYQTMLRETCIPVTKIRVDGGVCTNDFVMQLTTDLIGQKLARPVHHEISCRGAAFVAGLGVGFWKDKEELKRLHTADQMFVPRQAAQSGTELGVVSAEYEAVLRSWEKALQRSMGWYSSRA